MREYDKTAIQDSHSVVSSPSLHAMSLYDECREPILSSDHSIDHIACSSQTGIGEPIRSKYVLLSCMLTIGGSVRLLVKI